MRREGPPDQPDPSTHRDDLLQHVDAAAAAQRPLIKVVDIVLQRFGELEVPDEDLVDERRQQVGGVELADPGLARDALGEPVDRLDRPVVHGDDQVPAGQKVDLAADEASVVIGFQRLEDEVDPVGLAAELGPALGRAIRSMSPSRSPASRASASRFVGRTPVEIDPEKLVRPSGRPTVSGPTSMSRSWPCPSNSRPLMVLSGRREQQRADDRDQGDAVLRDEHAAVGAERL